MNIEETIFAFSLIGILFAAIFYVIFGQVTVRKLRKNPKTKDALGLEFASGWDILNVAQALAIPRSWSQKFKSSPLSFLEADAEILDKYTTKLDRILANIFYWLWVISGSSLIVLVLLDWIGVFE